MSNGTDEGKTGYLSSPFALAAGSTVASLTALVASGDETIRVIGAVGMIVLPLVYTVCNLILKLKGQS